jgi:hypothetical protein
VRPIQLPHRHGHCIGSAERKQIGVRDFGKAKIKVDGPGNERDDCLCGKSIQDLTGAAPGAREEHQKRLCKGTESAASICRHLRRSKVLGIQSTSERVRYSGATAFIPLAIDNCGEERKQRYLLQKEILRPERISPMSLDQKRWLLLYPSIFDLRCVQRKGRP